MPNLKSSKTDYDKAFVDAERRMKEGQFWRSLYFFPMVIPFWLGVMLIIQMVIFIIYCITNA